MAGLRRGKPGGALDGRSIYEGRPAESPPADRAQAARVIAGQYATDAADARELLDALGLLDTLAEDLSAGS